MFTMHSRRGVARRWKRLYAYSVQKLQCIWSIGLKAYKSALNVQILCMKPVAYIRSLKTKYVRKCVQSRHMVIKKNDLLNIHGMH